MKEQIRFMKFSAGFVFAAMALSCGGGASSPQQKSGAPGGGSTLQGTGGTGIGSLAGTGGGSSGGTGGAGGGGAAPDQKGTFGPGTATGNTNIALAGSQDFGYFRRLLDAGRMPETKDFDAAGFFGEHHTRMPPPACGERVCLQTMLAVMGSLSTGNACTMLQIGLNSPLVADPANRPPLTLAVSIDVSGSMNVGGKIDFVRAGLDKLIDGLRDGDRVAFITYSDAARTVFPMADVSLNRARLREIARALSANGGTNFYDGLERAYQEVMAHHDSGRQNRVIMLSDGQPTVGRTGQADILDMSRRFNSDGVGVTSIGLGTDFNASLMRTLAQQGDGNFYFLENSGAVSEVFTEEVNYFTVPVAYDLKVEMSAGVPYTFGRAYGSSFWSNTAGGGRLGVPSVFLAHRQSHADVTKDGGRRGGGSALLIELMPRSLADDGSGLGSADVATVKISFREPGTNRLVTSQVAVAYPFAPWVVPETGFFQSLDVPIVQKSFVMLNIYIALEEACRDFHLGLRRDLLARLRRLAAAVDDYNEEVKDTDIAADLALLNQFMQALRRNGVTDPSDVRIPANPWPAD